MLVDGQPVGVVTSGNFSPELGHGIALAFVPPDTRIGDTLAIDQRGSTRPRWSSSLREPTPLAAPSVQTPTAGFSAAVRQVG